MEGGRGGGRGRRSFCVHMNPYIEMNTLTFILPSIESAMPTLYLYARV